MSSCPSDLSPEETAALRAQREKELGAMVTKTLRWGIIQEALVPADFSGHVDMALGVSRAKVVARVLRTIADELEAIRD